MRIALNNQYSVNIQYFMWFITIMDTFEIKTEKYVNRFWSQKKVRFVRIGLFVYPFNL